jgi:hypothetical protein
MKDLESSILGWHFVSSTGLLRDGQKLECKLYEWDGQLKLCKAGFHGSVRALDALKYAPGPLVCQVKSSGKILHDIDKYVSNRREVLWYADAAKALHTFAYDEAERALSALADPDPRSLAAIAVKRRWIDGKATNAELDAARDAACAAAMAAVMDAELDAAWNAARYAAMDAELDAAWNAACAAAMAAAMAAVRAAVRAVAEDAAMAAAMATAMAAANQRLEATLVQLAPKSRETIYANHNVP